MSKKVLTCIFSLLFCLSAWAEGNSLTMVYRTTAKEPFISKAPLHEGVWKEVYAKAAKKIGLTLKIRRYPKKRAYQLLAKGQVDFYPASSFKPAREKIGFFIKNHLSKEGATVLFREGLPIKNVADIKGYELLNNLGSTTTFYKRAGISLDKNTLREIPELGIQRAVKLLQRGMSDVYAYSDIGIESFLQERSIKGIKKLAIDSKEKPSVLIFSKKSKHYKEKNNPNYNPGKSLSINNLPYRLDEDSLAYKFQGALKEMKISGEVKAILDSYQQ